LDADVAFLEGEEGGDAEEEVAAGKAVIFS
jgi:hypothetical protein